MLKIAFFMAVTGLIAVANDNASAQSRSIVDPGISTHNYKHPNKAAQAKSSANSIRVPTINTIERFGKIRGTNRGSSTPKYATRPAALVIQRTSEVEKLQINPLASSRNYKTKGRSSNLVNTELADIETISRDSVYPNQD
jgi:hypothetical protein